jgi:flagellar hook-associated protein FlgK
MSSELRDYAFEEMHHRLRQVRLYSLLDNDGSKITVRAALVRSDPPTVGNPANQKTLNLAAGAADDGTLFSWLDEEDGKQSLLTLAQIRSLAESLSAFETTMYDFLAKLSSEIDSGVITTFDQVDHAAWRPDRPIFRFGA